MTNIQVPLGAEKIGEISKEVKDVLGLDFAVGTPIYIGPTNIEHMEREHPLEYNRYFGQISKIIATPDFVGQNPKDESIEYIKIFETSAGQYVKLAMRISGDGFLFARSLYEILERTVKSRTEKGTIKSLTEHKE
ncbi:MAG: hypothetical protein LBH28_00435 [Oscillospiraceae bacterium]|jgi:hypothetical protein|nr:hypothetical protein [Oscillospiraceae bacterium]